MSILSNIAISEALKSGELKITPFNGTLDGTGFDECSVHLHLGNQVMVPEDDMLIEFDLAAADERPGAINRTLEQSFRKVDIPTTGWSLDKGKFALARTFEGITLPIMAKGRQLAGRIEGRSRFARIGLLVHFTAPTIHPGFGVDTSDGSPITLELKNLGPHPIKLRRRLPICQLILERVDGPVLRAPGAFDAQVDASGGAAEAA